MLELRIHQNKLKENISMLLRLVQKQNFSYHLDLSPVCSDERFVNLALEAGCRRFASTRLQDLQRLGRQAEELLLLRPPLPQEAADVVRLCDISLNSEWQTFCALSDAAVAQNRRHRVILLLEMGDLSFGTPLEDLLALLDQIMNLRGIRLCGLAAQFGYYGRVIPARKQFEQLLELSAALERRYNVQLDLLSAGAGASMALMDQGELPAGLNHIILDQVAFMGRETAYGRRVVGLNLDCFYLSSQVLECQRKDSLPQGEIGAPAHVRGAALEDEGKIRRAILEHGHQDISPENCRPLDSGIRFLGACEEFSVYNVSDYNRALKPGDRLDFAINAMGLRQLVGSPYVRKHLV